MFARTENMAPTSRGALRSKPVAQMYGSAFTFFAFSRWDRYDPSGTPMMPVVIVIAPNMNDTLLVCVCV